MQIIFEARHAEAGALRETALQRVRFALRRLRTLVLRAKVRFVDVNGPRGGVDKQCLLEVKTEKSGVLAISTVASDWRSALNAALDRLVRTLTRLLQRQHKGVRSRTTQTESGEH